MIVDEGSYLGGDWEQVQAAAKRLVNSGAEVRVMVLKTIQPYGNIDAYQDAMEESCASWRAKNGTRNNLIVIWLFVEDGESYIIAGEEWRKKLGDNKWNEIRMGRMSSRLRDGKIAAGVVAGLDDIRKELEYEPIGFGTIFLWIAGIGLFIFLAIYLPLLVRRRRREREERRAAQQKAKLAISSASALINELEEPIGFLEVKVNDVESRSSEEDAQPYRTRYDSLKSRIDNSMLEFGNLRQADNNPDHDGLSVPEYDAMAKSYQKVVDDLTKAKQDMNNLETEISDFKNQIDQAPSMIAACQIEIEKAGTIVDGISGQGFKVEDATAILSAAKQLKSDADTALNEKRFSAAIKLGQEACSKADEAKLSAEELPKLKQQLLEGITTLKKRVPQVDSQIDAGHEIFVAISTTYAESCWRTVQGNGSEAENRIDWSNQAIVEAEKLVAMDVQGFTEGLEIVEEANGWLDKAESLMRSISTLKSNLEAAKLEAPGEIDAAQADIDKATKYIATYDDDIRESLETDLANTQAHLDQARNELAKSMPDYIQVVKLAKQANSSADSILNQAEGEHEAAERLRLRAVTSLREARRSVSVTEEYIEDHDYDVDSDAESTLHTAKVYLSQAEAASDPAEIVQHAEAADKKADRALEMAEEDVSDAEDVRRRQREKEEKEARERRESQRRTTQAAAWGTRTSSPTSYKPSSHSSGFGGFGGGGGGGGRIGGGGSIGSSGRVGGGGKW
ncbi:MAG: TPM domain-containing protein [Patescibacteria group bacterium]